MRHFLVSVSLLSLCPLLAQADTAEKKPSDKELVRRADPRADDWDSERVQVDAGERLAELAGRIGAGELDPAALEELFAKDLRVPALRPSALSRTPRPGGTVVLRPPADAPASDPLPVAAALRRLRSIPHPFAALRPDLREP